MAVWVNASRVADFPEVMAVYKRDGRGQGTGQSGDGGTTPKSGRKGFLMTVKRLVSESNGAALPAWIRKAPGIGNSGLGNWQNAQVDITAIPGVRKLRATNGKWVNY